MRATRKQIEQMRSGQTFWTVRAIWDHYCDPNLSFSRKKNPCVLTTEVEQLTVIGKRTLVLHRSHSTTDVPDNQRPILFTSKRFVWSRRTKKDAEFKTWHDNNQRGSRPDFNPSWIHHFHEYGPQGGRITFTSHNAAKRFAQEVMEGLWPKLVEDAKEHFEMMKLFDEALDYYDEMDSRALREGARLPAEEDDSVPFYQDNGWPEEDRNLTLPNEFLTNFPIEQLPIYKEAVRRWVRPEDFEVRETNCDGLEGDGSLWFYGQSRFELSPFWATFEEVLESMKETTNEEQ